MQIAVNTRLLLPRKLEGIGWFTYEVFSRLVRQHPEVQWLFIFDRPYHPQFVFGPNVTPLVLSPPTRHPLLWYYWFEWRLPALLRKYQPDLFISPDGYLSLRSEVPSLPVIHDLNFEHHPQYLPRLVRFYYRYFYPRFARHATRVATVSRYSQQDIARTYGIDPEKIDLVYNGIGDFFSPLAEAEIREVRKQVSRGQPYFVFVGALNPRKNISGMLQAYRQYREQGGQDAFVIVGEKMFWDSEIRQRYQKHPYQADIYFTGRLEGQGLSRVLAASRALLFVSHFEGFGIPILEAFRCEVPVITSTTTSMPEVAGDAALLCEPENYAQIAEAMHRVRDNALRNDLIARGKKRLQAFSWENSARMMWDSIQKTLRE